MPSVGRAMVCAVFLGLLISVTSFAAKVNLRSDQDKQFDFRGAKNAAAGRMLTVRLTNDLDGTVYA